MNLFKRLFGISENERLRPEQADLWAARYYPAAWRTIAATPAVIGEAMDVPLMVFVVPSSHVDLMLEPGA